MEFQEQDLEDLQRQKEENDARNRKLNTFGAIGDILGSQTSVGMIANGMHPQQSNAVSNFAKGQMQDDPLEKYKSTLATYKLAREGKKSEQDQDPSSQRNIAMKATLQKMYPDRAEAFEGYTVSDHDKFMDPLKLRETIDARRSHDKMWTAARSGNASSKEDLRDAREEEKIRKYSNVGGWTLNEDATPTADDAKKFKSGVSDARSLLDNLNKYQDLVSRKGSEFAGKDAQDMESLARDIQLSAKGEGLYGLGVLSGPDLNLLEEIIRAPTGLMDQINPIAGSRAANKAQQFGDMLNTRINAKAKTYGFSPKEEWTSISSGKQPASGSMGASEAYAGQSDKNEIFTPKHATRLQELEAKYGKQ